MGQQLLTSSRLAAACVAIAAISLGCGRGDRYEVVQDAKGRTVRLDRQTGEVLVLEEGKFKKVTTPEEEASATSQLEALKSWPAIEIQPLGGLKVKLATSWIDGKLHYQFEVTPGEKALRAREKANSNSAFTILLIDAGGFKLLAVPVSLRSMERTYDSEGKLYSLDVNEAVACSSEVYRRIDRWNTIWNFGLD